MFLVFWIINILFIKFNIEWGGKEESVFLLEYYKIFEYERKR